MQVKMERRGVQRRRRRRRVSGHPRVLSQEEVPPAAQE